MLPYRREARSGAGLPGPLGTWYLGRMVVRCSLPGKNAFVSFLGGVWLCFEILCFNLFDPPASLETWL